MVLSKIAALNVLNQYSAEQPAGSAAPGIHDYISGPSHQTIVSVNCNGHPCNLDSNSCHCQSCMISGRGVLK